MKKQISNNKRIYYFSASLTEGNKDMRELLGSKGANLAEMTNLGLPVPPGFTITTASCAEYHAAAEKLPAGLMGALSRNIQTLEKETGKTLLPAARAAAIWPV